MWRFENSPVIVKYEHMAPQLSLCRQHLFYWPDHLPLHQLFKTVPLTRYRIAGQVSQSFNLKIIYII